ncbi:unnamed protein product, partial [Prunus brigantina]
LELDLSHCQSLDFLICLCLTLLISRFLHLPDLSQALRPLSALWNKKHPQIDE